MNYKPCDKVKVTVNGATWEDVIVSSTIGGYLLESGTVVCPIHLTPIIQDIEPEPGDIVEVWDGHTEEDHLIRIFDVISNGLFMCHEIHSKKVYPWQYCRVLARKPKKWDELTRDEKEMMYKLSEGQNAYDNLVSFILGGAPYARVDDD